jgi:hypothetical protein
MHQAGGEQERHGENADAARVLVGGASCGCASGEMGAEHLVRARRYRRGEGDVVVGVPVAVDDQRPPTADITSPP